MRQPTGRKSVHDLGLDVVHALYEVGQLALMARGRYVAKFLIVPVAQRGNEISHQSRLPASPSARRTTHSPCIGSRRERSRMTTGPQTCRVPHAS